jgi:hypothetical protein
MDELQRLIEAYMAMAEQVSYRPAAPSDGHGHILLTPEELADKDRLAREANHYAHRFVCEEEERVFHIGCTNYNTNRAFVYGLEALRCLCSGGADGLALDLFSMARVEIEEETRRAIAKIEKRGAA